MDVLEKQVRFKNNKTGYIYIRIDKVMNRALF